ncbi:MAG: HIT domain-containing protein [Bacteroidetes bacterium]|nr:HIT domain-containing protein [Bacteroidota bacterium]
MEKNVFQKIIDKEIPATIEYEDDRVIAIRDIAPSAPVHVLIIPKKYITSAHGITVDDADLIGHVYLVAQQLATTLGIDQSGYRVVTNVNADGGQTVFHLHFHLLGGEPLGRMNAARVASGKHGGRGILREAGLIVLFAIGLAAFYNAMSPKHLEWIKPTYTAVPVNDDAIDKLIATAPTPTPTPTPPAATTTTAATTPDRPQRTVDSPKTSTATPPPPAEQAGAARSLTLAQFKKLMGKPNVVLIDARLQEKYDQGHIGNAMNIYGSEVEQHIPELLAIPQDKIVIIYCDGGHCELSHRVADVFLRFGYPNVFVFLGGWAEWSAQK